MRGRGERGEGGENCIICVDFMVIRAEGAKIFGIQGRGRAHLIGPDFGRKKSSINL